jgi:hypothetical protein
MGACMGATRAATEVSDPRAIHTNKYVYVRPAGGRAARPPAARDLAAAMVAEARGYLIL